MLEAILLAAGRRAVAAGNVGRPLVEVVTARTADGAPSFDAIAVELSSFQLHWSSSIAPAAAARLARPGDTVLLAPAAASMDVFRDYAHRGRAFADAVRALG